MVNTKFPNFLGEYTPIPSSRKGLVPLALDLCLHIIVPIDPRDQVHCEEQRSIGLRMRMVFST
jgi:hypothetical protein